MTATYDGPAEAAIGYAARGMRVVVLHDNARGTCSCGRECGKSAGKHPRHGKWQTLATWDEETVRRWWSDWPNANVGIALGPQGPGSPALVGVDIDTANGEAILAAMADGDLPDTWEMKTGNGRRLIFGTPADTEAKTFSLKGDDTEAIRFQWTGGQCVVPPSIHYTGRLYEWSAGRSPVDGPPAPAPAWLLAAIAPPPPPESIPAAGPPPDENSPGSDFNRRADWWADILQPTGWRPAGTRGDVLYYCRPGKGGGTSATVNYCKAKDGGPALYVFSGSVPLLAMNKSYDKFGAYARLFCKGDFSTAAKELMVRGYGANRTRPNANGVPATPPAARAHPRSIPPYKPFPLDALPPTLRGLVVATAAAVGCDPAFAALPGLAVTAAAIGGAMVLEVKAGWQEPAGLWCVVVGDSGTAKSPAADPFLAAAEAVEDGLEMDYAKAMSARESDPPESDTDQTPPPKREYFLCGNTTIERLIENLQSSARGLLIHRDELATWFGGFTRYKGKGGGSDSAEWLSMFDGRSISYQRRTGQPRDVRVKRALVSVTGGIQPDILRGCLSDPMYVASGLAARLLFCYPPKKCPRWSDNVVDSDTQFRFRDTVAFLRRLPFGPRSGPAVVRPEFDGLARYVGWMDRQMSSADDIDGGPMAAALPKLTRVALRFALIHHCVSCAAADTDPARHRIGDRSMAAGVELADWFIAEAERVYDMLAERPEDSAIRKLVELVQRKGGSISPRGLMRANCRSYPTTEAAEAALESLVIAGFAAWEAGPASARGGWPTRLCVLCMTHDTRSHNYDEKTVDDDTRF